MWHEGSSRWRSEFTTELSCFAVCDLLQDAQVLPGAGDDQTNPVTTWLLRVIVERARRGGGESMSTVKRAGPAPGAQISSSLTNAARS
jgi:hypothetical protein